MRGLPETAAKKSWGYRFTVNESKTCEVVASNFPVLRSMPLSYWIEPSLRTVYRSSQTVWEMSIALTGCVMSETDSVARMSRKELKLTGMSNVERSDFLPVKKYRG